MQLLGYEACIKPQLLAIKSIPPLQTFGTMRLAKNFLQKKIHEIDELSCFAAVVPVTLE
jgi:hypothetical protein